MNNEIKRSRHQLPATIIGAAIALAGCAPAYHCYSDCHVNCRYCAPSPLPYSSYDTRVCHSWQAAQYVNGQPPSTNEPLSPQQTVPEQAVPEQTVPEQAVPEHGAPEHGAPEQASPRDAKTRAPRGSGDEWVISAPMQFGSSHPTDRMTADAKIPLHR